MIYPVDSTIQRLNNPGQVFSVVWNYLNPQLSCGWLLAKRYTFISCYRIPHEFSQKLHNLCTAVLDVKKRNLKTSVVTVMSLLALMSVVTVTSVVIVTSVLTVTSAVTVTCHLIQPHHLPSPPPSPRPPPPTISSPRRQTSLDLIRSGQFLSASNRLAALNTNTAYRRLV